MTSESKNLIFAFVDLNCRIQDTEIRMNGCKDSKLRIELEANNEFFKTERYKVWNRLKSINSDFVKDILIEKPASNKYKSLPFKLDQDYIQVLGFTPVPINTTAKHLKETSNQAIAVINSSEDQYLYKGFNLKINESTPFDEVLDTIAMLKKLSINEIYEIPVPVLRGFFNHFVNLFPVHISTEWVNMVDLTFNTLDTKTFNTDYDFRFELLEKFTKVIFITKPTLPSIIIKSDVINQLKDWLIVQYSKKNFRNVNIILSFLVAIPTFKPSDFNYTVLNDISHVEFNENIKLLLARDPNFKENVRPKDSAFSRRSLDSNSNTSSAAQSSTPIIPPMLSALKDIPQKELHRFAPKKTVPPPPPPATAPSEPTKFSFTSYLAQKKNNPAPPPPPPPPPVPIQGPETKFEPNQNVDPSKLKSILKDTTNTVKKKSNKRVLFKNDNELVTEHLIPGIVLKNRENRDQHLNFVELAKLNNDEGSQLRIQHQILAPLEENCHTHWVRPYAIKFNEIYNDEELSQISETKGGTMPYTKRAGLNEDLLSVIKKSHPISTINSPFEPDGLITPDKTFPLSDYEKIDEYDEQMVSESNLANKNHDQSVLDLLGDDGLFPNKRSIDDELMENNKKRRTSEDLPLPTRSNNTLPRPDSFNNTFSDHQEITRTQSYPPPPPRNQFSSRSGAFPPPPPLDHPFGLSKQDVEELRRRDVRPRVRNNAHKKQSNYNIPCRFYSTGSCQRQEDCFYLHLRD